MSSGASATFQAGVEIDLRTGFHAVAGSTFYALIAPPTDTISTPTPSGPSAVLAGTSYAFTAGGAVSSLGTPIQYFFYWGDGSNSGWLPAGTTAASHAWSAAGNYQVSLLARGATDYVTSQASALQVSVQDFSFVTNYTYAPVFAGNGVSVPIATTCANGFTGNINILQVSYGSLDAAPAAFSLYSFPCGGSTTIIIQAYAGAQPGYYQVTVTATSTVGGQSAQHLATVPVSVVTSQASGLVATPYAQTVAPGGAASFSVAPILTNGFTGTISLSCSSPSSLCPSVTFSPSSLSSSTPSTMTVTTAANTPPGAYTINVSGTSPGQNPVSTSVVLTVSGATGGPVTIAGPSVSQTFLVDGVSYAGSTSFARQPGGDTLRAAQTPLLASAQPLSYAFSTADNSAPRQGIPIPILPVGESGGGNCPWSCDSNGDGYCNTPIPTGQPSPAPTINSVAGALIAGGTATITIRGSNFGTTPGELFFCQQGASPCVLPSSGTPMSYNPYCTGCWSDTLIEVPVTLPSTAPTGPWWVYVISIAWLPPSAFTNPSMGAVEVDPGAQIMMGTTLVSGATTAASPSIVSVGQQIVLTGSVTGLPSGVSVSSQNWTIQGTTVASYVQTYNYSTRTSTAVQTALTQSNLAQPQVTFYWIDGDNGNNTVTYTVTYTANLSNGMPVTTNAYFRPVRPNPVSFSGTLTKTTPVINESSNELTDGNGIALPSMNFGYPDPDYGIQFNLSVTTTFGGNLALVQLASVNHAVTFTSGGMGTEASSGFVLDDPGKGTAPQYGGYTVSVPANAEGVSFDPPPTDTPAISLLNAAALSVGDSFQTYLMYQPPGANSIWVTLQTLSWSWNGSVSVVNGSWALGNGNSFSPTPAGATASGTSSTALPIWSGAATFLTYK